jgi:hypothetical protein
MTLARWEEYRKAVVAGVVALFAFLIFFVTFEPGTQEAAIAVVIAVFNVGSVFLNKNHTLDDVSKAVGALQASSLGLVTLFVTLDPTTVESIGAIVLAILNVYGVWKSINAPSSV